MDLHKTGQFISTLRREKGLTQRGLAERVGVTDKAVSRWETGRGFPDVSFLPALAQALEVSVSEIVAGERMALEEKNLDEIRAEMDRTVTDTLMFSQSELRHRRRVAARYLLGCLLLLAPLLLFACLPMYELFTELWPEHSFRSLLYGAMVFFVIPFGVPAAVQLLDWLYRQLSLAAEIALSLLAAFVLLLAVTAVFEPSFYTSLTDIELLRYDFNDTIVHEVLFVVAPVSLSITWLVNMIRFGLRALPRRKK